MCIGLISKHPLRRSVNCVQGGLIIDYRVEGLGLGLGFPTQDI